MVSAGDFRNGVTFEMEGNVYQIIEFQHVKPGKGAAFVRAKPLTPTINSPPLLLSVRKWNILTVTAISITLWIPKVMNSFP